ncbi:MAG: HD domain-containing protein [Patescibacteria group bacterium]
MTLIAKAKDFFLQTIKAAGHDKYGLVAHTAEMEKWVYRLKEMHPEADLEIILLTVWFHDISLYLGEEKDDHAVKSERIARVFLEKANYPKNKVDQVCHCVRAHRNRDIAPLTLEAKIIACTDSASHMTGEMYVSIAMAGKFDFLEGKIDRDYRDIGVFPELQQKIKPLYDNWKEFVSIYRSLNIVPEKEYNN